MGAIFGLVSVFSIKSSFQPHREYCLILMNYISPRFDSHLPIAKITGEWHTGRQKCFESFTLAVSHSKACFLRQHYHNLKICSAREIERHFLTFFILPLFGWFVYFFLQKKIRRSEVFFVLALFENSYHFFKSRGTPVTWVCMCRCGGGDREYI